MGVVNAVCRSSLIPVLKSDHIGSPTPELQARFPKGNDCGAYPWCRAPTPECKVLHAFLCSEMGRCIVTPRPHRCELAGGWPSDRRLRIPSALTSSLALVSPKRTTLLPRWRDGRSGIPLTYQRLTSAWPCPSGIHKANTILGNFTRPTFDTIHMYAPSRSADVLLG